MNMPLLMDPDTAPAIAIAAALLGAVGMTAALYSLRAVRRWRTHCLSVEASVAALRRELELMASITTKTGRRIMRMQQENAGMTERVRLVELRGAAPSFDRAIDSARQGADPDKLTQQYGLSRGEADLVTRLHGRKMRA